jgi:hypothetical protein
MLFAFYRLAAGSAWTDTGGMVFVTSCGESLYTVTALMTNARLHIFRRPLRHTHMHSFI